MVNLRDQGSTYQTSTELAPALWPNCNYQHSWSNKLRGEKCLPEKAYRDSRQKQILSLIHSIVNLWSENPKFRSFKPEAQGNPKMERRYFIATTITSSLLTNKLGPQWNLHCLSTSCPLPTDHRRVTKKLTYTEPKVIASTREGAVHRRDLVGGNPKGMPRKAVTPSAYFALLILQKSYSRL